MNKFHLIKRHFFPIAVIAITLAITVIGEPAFQRLIFDRSAILQGEFWRMLTGHFVHLEFSHLLLNQAGLLLVWLLFGNRLSSIQWAIVTLFCALLISAAFLILDAGIRYYVGFSAVLKGLFVLGCLLEIRRGQKIGWVLLALFAGLAVWERMHGGLPGSSSFIHGPVATGAHLYGAASGALVYIFILFGKKVP